MLIDKYEIHNTSGNRTRPDILRVLLDDVVIASVSPNKRNPLKYVRDYPQGKYGRSLRRQLTEAQVPQRVVDFIFMNI